MSVEVSLSCNVCFFLSSCRSLFRICRNFVRNMAQKQRQKRIVRNMAKQQQQQQQRKTSDLYSDDFHFSAVFNEDQSKLFGKYAEDLQYYEAVMASLNSFIASLKQAQENPTFIKVRKEVGQSSHSLSTATSIKVKKEVGQTSCSLSSATPLNVRKEAGQTSHSLSSATSIKVKKEVGQTSHSLSNATPMKEKKEIGQSTHNFCGICVEEKESMEMYTIRSCSHIFCWSCINNHVAAKIQDKISIVACPALNCHGVVELDETCRLIISKEVVEKWDNLICESLISNAHKFYCPFKDCSAMLVNDGGEVIRQSECPVCRRLFCAQCHAPWHPGIECAEFQKLNEDERGREDLMLRELAKNKNWRRCPNCHFYVEKSQGCLHMTCRCRYQFCYACGEKWTKHHGGCHGP